MTTLGGEQGLLRRLVRFGLVGVANTAVYYGLYRLVLALGAHYLVAHLGAWALSVVFSFLANCWFTYRVRPTRRRFLAFPLTTLVSLALTTVGSVVLVNGFGIDQRYATLAMGILAIPFTFALTTFVLTASRAPTGTVADPGAPGPDEVL